VNASGEPAELFVVARSPVYRAIEHLVLGLLSEIGTGSSSKP
jgi:hypothetical protein